MQAWHEKNFLETGFPFTLFTCDTAEYPPHWHEQIEVIYALEGPLEVGVNNEVYCLQQRDILIVGIGEVHYFPLQSKSCWRVIIQFETSFLESFAELMKDTRFIKPFFSCREDGGEETHRLLEQHILSIMEEDERKEEGYRMALKARMYDLMVTLLRKVPRENFSLQEKNRHLNRLERLEQVFRYVEKHYAREIYLEEVAMQANFSVFHFTRFFKETTGMTFGKYLNNFRVSKAMEALKDSVEPVTEIAFQTGFGSIKTFNRVFKQMKGCAPTAYRKSNI